jgi:hypothetical protein
MTRLILLADQAYDNGASVGRLTFWALIIAVVLWFAVKFMRRKG